MRVLVCTTTWFWLFNCLPPILNLTKPDNAWSANLMPACQTCTLAGQSVSHQCKLLSCTPPSPTPTYNVRLYSIHILYDSWTDIKGWPTWMSHQLTVGQTTSQQNHDTYVWGSEGGKGTTPQPLSEEDCQYEIAWQWGVDPLYALSAQILLLGGKNLIIGVEKSGEECRAAGCQSVWRPPVTLRTPPPHFFLRLYHPSTLFICVYHPCTLSICLYHTFIHPMIRRTFVGKKNTWGLFRAVPRKNVFYSVSLPEWVVPPIDQWFVIFVSSFVDIFLIISPFYKGKNWAKIFTNPFPR